MKNIKSYKYRYREKERDREGWVYLKEMTGEEYKIWGFIFQISRTRERISIERPNLRDDEFSQAKRKRRELENQINDMYELGSGFM